MSWQEIVETWNGITNAQPAREFMNVSRQILGDTATVEECVDAYVKEIPSMFNQGDWTPDALESVRGAMVAYLERTQGDEW